MCRKEFSKATGMDGIIAEMLKYGGQIRVKWMCLICDLAWRQREVPDEWKKAFIVPLHKSKGSKDECNNYRGINLYNVPGKVYGRVLMERLMEVTEGKVSKEQEGFRKRKGMCKPDICN